MKRAGSLLERSDSSEVPHQFRSEDLDLLSDSLHESKSQENDAISQELPNPGHHDDIYMRFQLAVAFLEQEIKLPHQATPSLEVAHNVHSQLLVLCYVLCI